VEPRLVEFMGRSGYDLGDRKPRRLDTDPESLIGVHVIVGLEADTRKHVPELPFRTVLLEWSLAGGAPGAEGLTDGKLTNDYQELVAKICDLMETLRGEVTA
jgi:hypothetical protein